MKKDRDICDGATPGDWPNYNNPEIREQLWNHYDSDKSRLFRSPICIPNSDTKFIAHFNPEKIKKMLDVIEAAMVFVDTEIDDHSFAELGQLNDAIERYRDGV